MTDSYKFIRSVDSARSRARNETARLEAWSEFYGPDVMMRSGLTRRQLAAAARALGDEPDPVAMTQATYGIFSWPTCSRCKEDTDFVVVVGEEQNYESDTAVLCMPCLRGSLEEAERAFESHNKDNS